MTMPSAAKMFYLLEKIIPDLILHVQLVFTANTGATNGQVAELEIYGE